MPKQTKKQIFKFLFIFFIIAGLFWAGVLISQNQESLKTWLAGKYGASADIVTLSSSQASVPKEVQPVNNEVAAYILPQNDQVIGMVAITPGKSNWDKQEEARLAAEQAKADQAKKDAAAKAAQVDSTAGFCTDVSSRYIDVSLGRQRLALCNLGATEAVYPISSGSRQFPTPTGHYQINSKSLRAYSTMYNLYMPYWNSFIGNSYGIHELPEYPNGYKEGVGMLGHAVSHGCIRLGVGDAAVVYNWAPVGTPVEVHQ